MRNILWFSLMLFFASCQTTKPNVVEFANNVVVAHRGAWKQNNFPENSIAAVKNAVQLKCTGSEFDVRMTADDSLIVTHDPHYFELLVEESTFAELSAFPLTNGETLPTLRQYLTAGMSNNKSTRLVLEIKPSQDNIRGLRIAEKVVHLVNEMQAQPMVIYISFNYDILKKIESMNPAVHTQYLDGSKSPEQVKADGIDGIDYHFSVFKEHPEWIASAKKHDIALNAWTVNEPADMDFFLENNFDFITTNEPEILLERSKAFSGN